MGCRLEDRIKHIIVTKCQECPHFEIRGLAQVVERPYQQVGGCRKVNRVIAPMPVMHKTFIPMWCPL